MEIAFLTKRPALVRIVLMMFNMVDVWMNHSLDQCLGNCTAELLIQKFECVLNLWQHRGLHKIFCVLCFHRQISRYMFWTRRWTCRTCPFRRTTQATAPSSSQPPLSNSTVATVSNPYPLPVLTPKAEKLYCPVQPHSLMFPFAFSCKLKTICMQLTKLLVHNNRLIRLTKALRQFLFLMVS